MGGNDKIKLTKNDSSDKKHHVIPVSWVDHVDAHVHLNVPANDARAKWSEAS